MRTSTILITTLLFGLGLANATETGTTAHEKPRETHVTLQPGIYRFRVDTFFQNITENCRRGNFFKYNSDNAALEVQVLKEQSDFSLTIPGKIWHPSVLTIPNPIYGKPLKIATEMDIKFPTKDPHRYAVTANGTLLPEKIDLTFTFRRLHDDGKQPYCTVTYNVKSRDEKK